ncbi:hypothetical protein [Streptomyces sp. WMMC905]|uniref:hypothetical protein n=1 Tax=Streptomyces sp. WMMC905 TaxID=3404123 RepID=UPI003B94200E
MNERQQDARPEWPWSTGGARANRGRPGPASDEPTDVLPPIAATHLIPATGEAASEAVPRQPGPADREAFRRDTSSHAHPSPDGGSLPFLDARGEVPGGSEGAGARTEPGTGHTHDPHEVTVQLDAVQLGDGSLRRVDGGPRRDPAHADRPVFVDTSGRRGRRVRRLGLAVGVASAGYAVVMVATLLSGNSAAPWLPVPARPGETAGQVETDPRPAESPEPTAAVDEAAPRTPAPGDVTASPVTGVESPAAAPGVPAGVTEPPTRTTETGTVPEPTTASSGPASEGVVVAPDPVAPEPDPEPDPEVSPPAGDDGVPETDDPPAPADGSDEGDGDTDPELSAGAGVAPLAAGPARAGGDANTGTSPSSSQEFTF